MEYQSEFLISTALPLPKPASFLPQDHQQTLECISACVYPLFSLKQLASVCEEIP